MYPSLQLLHRTYGWSLHEETIHKYDVEAEGWGTLGELRAEILQNAVIEHHTTKEEWLSPATATTR